MYISVEQALEVYDELILAKEGDGSVSENETEIYAYRLLPHAYPKIKVTPSGDIIYDNKLEEQNAAEDLHTLCGLFEQKHSVKITIDNKNIDDWIKTIRSGLNQFNTRVRIKVDKK
jgi:hypothetical protein